MNADKSECKVQAYLGEKQVQFALQSGQATEGGYPRLYHVIQVTETVYEVRVLQHTHHLSLWQQHDIVTATNRKIQRRIPTVIKYEV